MMEEVYRVLKPNGVYICISYGHEDARMSYFQKEKFKWDISLVKVAKPALSTSTETRDERNLKLDSVFIMKKSDN